MGLGRGFGAAEAGAAERASRQTRAAAKVAPSVRVVVPEDPTKTSIVRSVRFLESA
jgi:hypothetical protein